VYPEVGEHQLGLDRLDVGDRVDRVGDVRHIAIVEAAHHMRDPVDLADVPEKLVAEPSPLETPFTSPAMSTKVSRVGTISADFASFASVSSRGSGTATSPTFGSMALRRSG